MNINIKTVFSKPRVETWYKFHMMRMDKSRYLHYIALALMTLAMVLSITVFKSFQYSTYAFVILIIMFFTLMASRPYRIYRAYKKIISKSPLTEKPFSVTFSDEGIKYEMDGEIQKFTWEQIVTVREIIDSFYVYVSETKAMIVPKYLIERKEREELVEVFKVKTHYKKHKFGQVAGD